MPNNTNKVRTYPLAQERPGRPLQEFISGGNQKQRMLTNTSFPLFPLPVSYLLFVLSFSTSVYFTDLIKYPILVNSSDYLPFFEVFPHRVRRSRNGVASARRFKIRPKKSKMYPFYFLKYQRHMMYFYNNLELFTIYGLLLCQFIFFISLSKTFFMEAHMT